MAKAVDLLINFGIFLYKGIGGGNVGLWLVVVEIANKVVHGIIWEVGSELGVKLSRKGFVMRDDEGWFAGLLDEIRHGKGFTRAGDPKEDLLFLARSQAIHQFFDSSWLIPSWLIGGFKLKFVLFGGFIHPYILAKIV